jgi:uncharacterized protein (TIGR02145 family)
VVVTVAGKKLKATSGWNDNAGKSSNGTDDYGFSALPGGGIECGSSPFYACWSICVSGNEGCWWISQTNIVGSPYYFKISRLGACEKYHNLHEEGLLSVRCVQD